MGTPAFIGIQNENGSVNGAYCHNGSFEQIGAILDANYYEEFQVEDLLGLGNLSVIRENPGSCVAYARDMGRSNDRFGVYFMNRDSIRKAGSYYAFFLFADGQWLVSEGGRIYTPLEDALKQMGVDQPVTA